MLPSATLAIGLQIADDISQTTRRLAIEASGESLRLTVSIGIAAVPDDGIRIEELIATADRRVYLAKARGRDRVILSDEPLTPPGPSDAPDDMIGPARRHSDRPALPPVI